VKARDVRSYLEELEKTKEGKSEQVKDGLEIYIDLWRRAMERRVVAETDTVDEALAKIEGSGGLYRAAGE
jgi:hypothetical protein